MSLSRPQFTLITNGYLSLQHRLATEVIARVHPLYGVSRNPNIFHPSFIRASPSLVRIFSSTAHSSSPKLNFQTSWETISPFSLQSIAPQKVAAYGKPKSILYEFQVLGTLNYWFLLLIIQAKNIVAINNQTNGPSNVVFGLPTMANARWFRGNEQNTQSSCVIHSQFLAISGWGHIEHGVTSLTILPNSH